MDREDDTSSSGYSATDRESADSAETVSLVAWGSRVGTEGRKTYLRFLRDGFFKKYMSGKAILDIGYKGYEKNIHPVLPHAIGIDLDYPDYDGKVLPFETESQDAIFSSHTLEHIADYRSAIRDWFRVVRVGGYMIIIVPHQFLYERRRQPPSRWNQDHKRFYTAGSLLREIEEALDPTEYRVRVMEDNDADYDYTLPLEQHPGGSYEIICVLQKVARPMWADAIFSPPAAARERSLRLEPKPDPKVKEPIKLITSRPLKAERVLAMKLDHRGDFTLARQAFESLRRNFREAQLTLLCGSWNVEDARKLQLFDDIVVFDYFPEHAGQASHSRSEAFSTDKKARDALGQLLDGKQFDLAVDLRMDPDTRHLLLAVKATKRAGFGNTSYFKFLDVAAPIMQATGAGKALSIYFGAPKFISTLGEHHGFAIDIDHEDLLVGGSVLVYGPYEPLPAGRYELQFLLEARDQPLRLEYDICTDFARNLIRAGKIDVEPLAPVSPVGFELDANTVGLEFRLLVDDSGRAPPFRYFGCSVRRYGARNGTHQTEAMLILADLAFAALRQTYEERTLS